MFTLLALESLGVDGVVRQALFTVTLTVLLSVIAHGFSADPLANRFAAWVQRAQLAVETGGALEPRPRGALVRGGGP